MKNKQRVRLTYTWWIYLVVAILIIALWIFVFDRLAQPKPNEKLLVSVAANHIQTDNMEQDLKDRLPQLSAQNVKQVTVESIPFDSTYNLTNALFSRSLDADIIIVAHSAMFEGIGEGYFPPINETEYKKAFGEVEFFREKSGVAYGILLYDGQTANNFSKYYTGTDKCWLFISGECVNTAGLNGKGESGNDAAVQTIKWLLEKQ